MNATTRRRFLAAVATGAGVGLAGCGTASCSEGERPSPAAVVEPASETTAASPSGDAGWAMHGRDPENTSYAPGLPDDRPEHRFTVDLGDGEVWPVAVGDRVYVAGAGGVRALHAADGSEAWTNSEIAPAHPPAIDGERVYVAGDDVLAALDRTTGRFDGGTWTGRASAHRCQPRGGSS